jgi:Zn-dependent protease with chaperone function
MSTTSGGDNPLGLDYSALLPPASRSAIPGSAAPANYSSPTMKSTVAPDPSGMRRTVHVSALSTLLLAAPGAFYSLMCLSIFGGLLGSGGADLGFLVWLVPLVWVSVGALLFYPPIEKVFLRVLMGHREPTVQEQQVLGPLWTKVTASAGLSRDKFILGVENNPELNASAFAGRSIVVTTKALQSLDSRHLEAVLAHELGHHLGGHPAALLWNYWIALPGRFLNRSVQRSYGALNRLILRFSYQGWLFSWAFVALLAIGLLLAAPWLLLVLLVPAGLAAAGRASELAADKIAVQLGYGQALVELLEAFNATGPASAGGLRRRFDGWMESHPSPAARIRRIERLLGAKT